MDADNDDHEHPEELSGCEWTDRTLSDVALCRLLGRAVIGGSESPVGTDAGYWSAEYDRAGYLARWRFYRDPDARDAI
ncbi:hypothetical protein [Methylobacterium soli]|uniref:Uncharacterized protein n=1 Tax=Methylobacterium soli TaxID=553447 RepID=A0A6L3T7Q6_9HYPH|nr:hypothetical protein [Methylobacterium soli]KAB1081428.1 hypothetical protein F6X53_03745 [Methylobacterium soli]GJE43968.1 hypothetical protein AEGHOMDF_3154 [Methylobacterium soli]